MPNFKYIKKMSLQAQLKQTRKGTPEYFKIILRIIEENQLPILDIEHSDRNITLMLNDCSLDDEDIIDLVSALENNEYVYSIDLSNNKIGNEGAVALANVSRLLDLNLSRNQIGNEGSNAFSKNNTLLYLNLSANQINQVQFSQNTTLAHLDISSNNIGDSGATDLALNSSIQSLSATGCGFTNEGIYKLSQNTNIYELSIAQYPGLDVSVFGTFSNHQNRYYHLSLGNIQIHKVKELGSSSDFERYYRERFIKCALSISYTFINRVHPGNYDYFDNDYCDYRTVNSLISSYQNVRKSEQDQQALLEKFANYQPCTWRHRHTELVERLSKFIAQSIRSIENEYFVLNNSHRGINQQRSIPNGYECPITQQIMFDPVIASDGHSYEREAITQWFSEHDTSPKTNQITENKNVLFPNLSLKQAIFSFLSEYPFYQAEQYLPRSKKEQMLSTITNSQTSELIALLKEDIRYATESLKTESLEKIYAEKDLPTQDADRKSLYLIEYICEKADEKCLKAVINYLRDYDLTELINDQKIFGRCFANLAKRNMVACIEFLAKKLDYRVFTQSKNYNPQHLFNKLVADIIKSGDLNALKDFISSGLPQLTALDQDGNSFLHLAVIHNQQKIALWLIKTNYQLEKICNNKGERPRNIATGDFRDYIIQRYQKQKILFFVKPLQEKIDFLLKENLLLKQNIDEQQSQSTSQPQISVAAEIPANDDVEKYVPSITPKFS